MFCAVNHAWYVLDTVMNFVYDVLVGSSVNFEIIFSKFFYVVWWMANTHLNSLFFVQLGLSF